MAEAVHFSIDVDVLNAEAVDFLAIQSIAWTQTSLSSTGHERVEILHSGPQTIGWIDTSPRLLDYLNSSQFPADLPPDDVGLGFAFFTRADVADGPVEFSAIVDNFSASIQTVPEPSTNLAVLPIAIALECLRRRRPNAQKLVN